MGRSDAVQFTLEVVAEWRRLGARVTFEPGWETRGNGQSANYEGALIHHTGFGSSLANPNPGRNTLINGRPDLTGPLCNSTGPACADNDPWIHVISAHPANHAGASGGRSMGPLPVTSLFNPRVWGHETDYGGNVPMLSGQYTAGLIVSRGVCNVLARSTEYTRAHAETSITGKWDAGYAPNQTIDMAAFRQAAAAYQGDDMPLSQDDLNKISVVVRDWAHTAAVQALQDGVIDWGNKDSTGAPIKESVAQQAADNAKAIAALSDKFDALAAKVGSGTSGGSLPTELDLPSLAKAFADELDRRARDGNPATGPVS